MLALLLLHLIITSFTPKFCGAIIHGDDAEAGEFPFAVSLRNESGRNYCGGSLITTRHIVTSADCFFTDESMLHGEKDVRYKPEDVTVLVGSIDADSGSGGKIYEVERLTPHSNYSILTPISLLYDIGIVTLKEDVDPSLARPIEIFYGELEPGMQATQIGWGVSYEALISSMITSRVLQKLQSNIIDSVTCVKKLEDVIDWIQYFRGPVANNNLICLYNNINAGICYRDSGSPLIVNDKLAAIATSGVPCAKNYPDLYTPLSNYQEFILREINNENYV